MGGRNTGSGKAFQSLMPSFQLGGMRTAQGVSRFSQREVDGSTKARRARLIGSVGFTFVQGGMASSGNRKLAGWGNDVPFRHTRP